VTEILLMFVVGFGGPKYFNVATFLDDLKSILIYTVGKSVTPGA
jgi:hypothetical protein